MSTETLTLSILTLLIALFALAQLASRFEQRHQLTSRQAAEYSQQARRCRALLGTLPLQLQGEHWIRLLMEIELAWTERHLELFPKKSDLQQQAQALRERLQPPIQTPEISEDAIDTEVRLSMIKEQLHERHQILTTAARNRILPIEQARSWQHRNQLSLYQANIEYLTHRGQAALREDHRATARSSLERARHLLQTHPELPDQASRLSAVDKLLEQVSQAARAAATKKAATKAKAAPEATQESVSARD